MATTKITLDNGEVLIAPGSQELDQAIMGCHYVVAVIPCHGVDALMLGPDREEYSATMEAMVLTADGVIRPLEYHRDEGSWEQGMQLHRLYTQTGRISAPRNITSAS